MIKVEPRNLHFNEALHKYTDDLGNVYTSVTQLLGEVTPRFDEKYWLAYKALEGKGFRVRPYYETKEIGVDGVRYSLHNLYNETAFVAVGVQAAMQEIKKRWNQIKDTSIEKGNRTHKYLEDCINAMQPTEKVSISHLVNNLNRFGYKLVITNIEELNNSPLKHSHPLIYERLHHFILDGWTIYAEKRVYSSGHLVAGTIDVFIVKGRQFYIFDWKTNKDELKFSAGYYKKEWQEVDGKRVKVPTGEWIFTNDSFLTPLPHIPHCKGEVYTMQLSLYAYICELWGLECLGLILFHIRDNKDPLPYDIVYRKLDAEILLDWRLEQLTKPVEEETGFGIR